jgi:hypothetical protein
MDITNQTIVASVVASNIWSLIVEYDATFRNDEVNLPHNYTFQDRIKIRETDWVTHDDNVTGWLCKDEFNPNSRLVHRKFDARVNSDDLDTEPGGEEIYAYIELRNVTTGGVPLVKRTPTVYLNP